MNTYPILRVHARVSERPGLQTRLGNPYMDTLRSVELTLSISIGAKVNLRTYTGDISFLGQYPWMYICVIHSTDERFLHTVLPRFKATSIDEGNMSVLTSRLFSSEYVTFRSKFTLLTLECYM